jgi:hypothetical protein
MTGQHADFEAVSAYVDGEAPEWADHVEGCARCRATAAQIRAVANAMSRPVVGPSEAEREAAVAAAVESFSTSDGVGGGDVPTVVPLGDRRRSRLAPERPASGRPGRSRPWAVPAVAAVIIGVLGFSGLVLSSYRSSDNDSTTLAGPGLQADSAESGVAANAPAAPPGDLGDVPDAATLRARAQLPAAARSAVSASPGAASDAASNPVLSAGPTSAAGGTVAPQASPPTTTLNQRAANPNVVGTRPCEERARMREPGLRELVYFATARQGQEQAFVLGFVTGPAPSPVSLLLLAQDDCAELLRSTGP